MTTVGLWITAAGIIVGLAFITVAVVGLIRLPDTFLALHAVGKATTFGISALVLASFGAGDLWLAGKALLLGAFILITAPVSTHALARAAYVRREPGRNEDASEGC